MRSHRARAGEREGNWQVFADLGLALVLVLFAVVAYQFVRNRDFWLREKIVFSQERVDSIIREHLADTSRYRVCPPDGDRQAIVFGADATFEIGDWRLKREGAELFQRLGAVLAEVDTVLGQIDVEGHTDSVRINRVGVRSNWQLSTLRALAVTDSLRTRPTLDSRKLAVVGRGRWREAMSNQTEEGRAANRRIEISLVYSPEVLGPVGMESLGALFDTIGNRVRRRIDVLPQPSSALQTRPFFRPRCRGEARLPVVR